MSDEKLILNQIDSETKSIARKYGDKRRSIIINESPNLTETDVVTKLTTFLN